MEQIKAVFELRAAAEAGFRPDLVACAGCGKAELETYYFDVSGGIFRCEDCFRAAESSFSAAASKQSEADSIYHTGQLISLLSPSVYARLERIFAFELKDDAQRDFSAVCEKYLLCHLERNFSTLDFYHSVRDNP